MKPFTYNPENSLSEADQRAIYDCGAAGGQLTKLQSRYGQYAPFGILHAHGFCWPDGDTIILQTKPVRVAEDEPPKPDKRRAFKEHKLKPAVIPPTISLDFSDEWRQHPGMPDLFIHRGQFAIQQKASRRRGIYWKPVARQSYKGKDYFVHWKRNKRVAIPVYRAMYECGHWFKKKD